VVTAARDAISREDVDVVLPFVPEAGEDEVRHAFELTLKARAQGPEAAEVADRWFFETVVRVHRAGEGAAFTGLKPAGLDVGPAIPLAEAAIESGDPTALTALLTTEVAHEVRSRLAAVIAARVRAGESVADARAYVSAMLGLQVWSHHLHQAIRAPR
jgi:hypothetical protein